MNKLRTGVASAYLVLCILLGGASAAGASANALLQLLALAILVVHFWSRGAPPLARDGRWLVVIFLAFAAIPAIQLVPLSPSIWTGLPGRDIVAQSLRLLGLAPADMPASLDARRTASSMLWLLPPAAMFLVATRLTRDERSVVAQVLLAMSVASIVLGALQLMGGNSSPLRLYDVTNADRSVGFFANANHVATLMLCSLPFAILFIARAKKARRGSGGREGRGFIYGAIAVFIAVGIAMNGSLAAYAMLIPVAAASFFLYKQSTGTKMSARGWSVVGLAALLTVGLSVMGPLSGERFAGKFEDNNTIGRKVSVPLTIEAARDHFPVGSGLGTFRDIYRTYERPEDASFVYVNHAHNDYAEVALELGLPGILVVLAFMLWWLTRTWSAWRSDYDGVALARAGSIAIAVVLVHSLVDYPLRASTIAVVAALAAGFMIRPPASRSKQSRERSGDTGGARHFDPDAA